MELPNVTTARAAEIVGIGYEGLRSQLKRGLLKNVGVMAPFYGRDAEAEVLYAKRWRWSKFGVTDLCLMRTAKLLMDAGCSFDVANDIASSEDLWRWFNRASDHEGAFLTVIPGLNSYCLYRPEDYELLTVDHAGYGDTVILVSLGAIYGEVTGAVAERVDVDISDIVDREAVDALCKLLAEDEGLEISDLTARLVDLFERPRDEIMSQLLAERRPPWKVLTDEVIPISDFLRMQGVTSGRIRFPQDDEAYDAWVRRDDRDWEGIEATVALARSQILLANAERGKKVKAGFLGLPNKTSGPAVAAALKRPRVLHSRRGVEAQVEAGIRASLETKNKPQKYSGGTLLIAAQLMRLPDDGWNEMAERIRDAAEEMPFDEVYVIDDRQEPPRLLRLK
jgi:hypothetical protein